MTIKKTQLHFACNPSSTANGREDSIMKRIVTRVANAIKFIGKVSLVGGFFGMAGLQPALAAVPISQQPLTIMDMIPPNIMLMLDDSGSMAWEFTPDSSYLEDTSKDGLRNVEVNRAYYDPNVVYVLPPKAGGGRYEEPVSLTNAWMDGFSRSRSCDITQYPESSGCRGTGSLSNYQLYESFKSSISCKSSNNYCGTGDRYTSSYDAVLACETGDVGPDAHNMCQERVPNYTFYDAEDVYICTRTNWRGDCTRGYWDKRCTNGGTLQTDGQCRKLNGYDNGETYAALSSCPYGGGFDPETNKCSSVNANLFVYTTKTESGDYERHYVGKSADDCRAAPLGSECFSDAATQKNVKIWFSYYRTRMLLAKSGLMNAFSTMSEKYRFGWGSFHNNGGIKAGDSTKQGGYTLARVKPFGNGQTAGDHKNKFWDWIVATSPSGGTPLRSALKSMGDYYGTKQPWEHLNEATNKTEMLSCRQSYAILTTDGFWNGSSPGVGNADKNKGSIISGPNHDPYEYVATDPFRDDTSNTLADVAMEYWKTDLMPDLDNKVPTSNDDPAFWQHMVTFTIGMGFPPVIGSASRTIERDDIDALLAWTRTGSKPASLDWWPGWDAAKPSSDSKFNITDMVHAAINGRGDFYQADNPHGFANALRSALNRASERTGSGASLATSAAQLDVGTRIYQVLYHTNKWTGELKAYGVDSNGGIDGMVWTASDKMPSVDDRNIYTMGASDKMVELTHANLTTAQKNALDADSTISSLMVDYIRGASNAGEAAPEEGWRARSGLLGDIVNSQPVFVGAPEVNQFAGRSFTGLSSYAAYVAAQKARDEVVYVAANDGMLHGFNADTGVETFAYLPSSVITHGGELGGIRQFALDNYGSLENPHQYFNDGMLMVADAYFDNAWHRVLVGGTGRGLAKSIYALDVTDPDNVTLLWERSAADGKVGSNYIGQMIGHPIIAMVADGEWAVLMGNGFNSSAGQSALLQFDVKSGSLKVHQVDGTGGNGLSTPGVWIDELSTGIASTAYAGDEQGNVWYFELGKQTASAKKGKLLFVAKDGDGNRQPISAAITVAYNPENNDKWIFFGTGKMLDSGDRSNTSLQTWYGLIVSSEENAARAINSSKTKADLAKREIIYQDAGGTDKKPARLVTSSEDAESIDGKAGWYIDLQYGKNKLGEGMVIPNQIYNNLLIGTSRVEDSSDPCSPGGKGWVMAVMPFQGTNLEETFFDSNGDGKFDEGDMIEVDGKKYVQMGMGFENVPNNPLFIEDAMITGCVGDSCTNEGPDPTKLNLTGMVQVRSWRELLGW